MYFGLGGVAKVFYEINHQSVQVSLAPRLPIVGIPLLDVSLQTFKFSYLLILKVKENYVKLLNDKQFTSYRNTTFTHPHNMRVPDYKVFSCTLH